MGERGRRLVIALASLGLITFFGEVVRYAVSFSRPALDFDVGPGTGAYLEGFTESEERPPVSFRWTTARASVSIPLTGEGEGALYIRYGRFLEKNAQVRLFVQGRPAGTFSARSGRFRTQEVPIRLDGGPLFLELLVEDPDPSRLGIAIDWIRVEGARWRLPLPRLSSRVLLSGSFLLTVALGFSISTALAASGALAVLQALFFGRAPFAMAHVHDEIAWGGLVASGLVALAFARGRSGRFVPLLFLASYLLKGAALFHPSYFYPDVRLHRRHLEAFEAAEGSLVERGLEAQKRARTGYPRRIAGRDYALPYSPMFYVPFTLAERDARGTEALMKQVGLVIAAAEVPLVYLLGRALAGSGVAFWASLLATVLPATASRLLFAQWPTLAGHFLDLCAILFAVRMAARPQKIGPLLAYAACGLASCLTYISSLFNLSLFTLSFALFERRGALRLLALWTGIAVATVLLLYLPFTKAFFSEILPALMAGAAASPESGPSLLTGVTTALARIPLFYGYGFPALALAGFVAARRRLPPASNRLLAAYGAAFLLLLALRAASGVFKDLKEVLFVGPWVAVTAAVSLEVLAARGRSGRFAAALVAIGLVGFGLGRLAEYTSLHTSLAGLD